MSEDDEPPPMILEPVEDSHDFWPMGAADIEDEDDVECLRFALVSAALLVRNL